MTTRGERIKEARLFWQSQGDGRSVLLLCRTLGISEPTYYNWEGDKVDDILAGNLMKFCKLTGFHPNYIESNKRPRMLSEDEAASALLALVDDFSQDELKDLVKYAGMIINNRRQRAGGSET